MRENEAVHYHGDQGHHETLDANKHLLLGSKASINAGNALDVLETECGTKPSGFEVTHRIEKPVQACQR